MEGSSKTYAEAVKGKQTTVLGIKGIEETVKEVKKLREENEQIKERLMMEQIWNQKELQKRIEQIEIEESEEKSTKEQEKWWIRIYEKINKFFEEIYQYEDQE
ncbi:5988_t:CDS:2, partial [Diversispora eburnea]